MSRKTSVNSLRQISDINLTPLMDLTFILLITFIITFPLIEQGIPVNLPAGKANSLTPDRALSVTVDVLGRIYLEDSPVTLEELGKQVRALGAAGSGPTVMVRADEGVLYGKVAQVMKTLHGAGVSGMALVTKAEGDGR